MTPRHYGSKQPTKAALRSALSMLITMRDNLDTVDCASLARSYGVSEGQIAETIAAEKVRRLLRRAA